MAAPYYFNWDTPKQQAVASVEHTVPVYPTLSIKSIALVSPNPRTTAVSIIKVTFSEPINTSSLTAGALVLTDNGGANLINSSVTVTRLSGDTYVIGGLAALTQTLGTYTFTVNTADIHSQYGSVGTGSLSTSWVMQSATVTANAVLGPVANQGFPFTVTAALPTQPASLAVVNTAIPVYVSTPGPSAFWQSLTPVIQSPDFTSTNLPGTNETWYVFTPTGEKRKSTDVWR